MVKPWLEFEWRGLFSEKVFLIEQSRSHREELLALPRVQYMIWSGEIGVSEDPSEGRCCGEMYLYEELDDRRSRW